MKKHYLRTLIALVGIAGFGYSAKAQSPDQLEVKIPYEFVAAGKTLPAGSYRLSRVSSDSVGGPLVLRNLEKRTGTFVLPIQYQTGSTDKVYLVFEQVGDRHFLSAIQTADHLFTIQVSKKEILEAQSQSTTSTSGSATGNN